MLAFVVYSFTVPILSQRREASAGVHVIIVVVVIVIVVIVVVIIIIIVVVNVDGVDEAEDGVGHGEDEREEAESGELPVTPCRQDKMSTVCYCQAHRLYGLDTSNSTSSLCPNTLLSSVVQPLGTLCNKGPWKKEFH